MKFILIIIFISTFTMFFFYMKEASKQAENDTLNKSLVNTKVKKLDRDTIDKINSYRIKEPSVVGESVKIKSFRGVFEAEEVDSEWAHATESEFAFVVEDDDIELDIECRTTLCQGKVLFDAIPGSSAKEKKQDFMQIFSDMLYSDIGMTGDLSLDGIQQSTENDSFSFSFSFGRDTGTLHNYRSIFESDETLRAAYYTQLREIEISRRKN